MGLLADFENPGGGRPHQTYTLHFGIEKFEVAVPLKEAQPFEAAIKGLKPKTKAEIFEVLKQHGGRNI